MVKQLNGQYLSLRAGSLTEVEIESRNFAKFSMADGHAAQYDMPWVQEMVGLLPDFETLAAKLRDREIEHEYDSKFKTLFGQTAGIGRNFKILPNASQSIDVVMSLCARRKWAIQLIDPCFDNLYLYARERGVETHALHESQLRDLGVDAIDTRQCQMIFLVTPNNPTGFTLSADAFRAIAEKCARDRATLAIDASFRAYDRSGIDQYGVLQEAGCSWVVIEDTGKTWPTRERKASIITCSNDLKRDINEICEVHVLGWCPPILVMLNHLIDKFQTIGLDLGVHARVKAGRDLIRKAVSGTILRPAAVDSNLPVEWLQILDDRYSDLLVTEHLATFGLGVLPGRHFHWKAASEGHAINNFLRVSLLKEMDVLVGGAERLRAGMLDIERSINRT